MSSIKQVQSNLFRVEFLGIIHKYPMVINPGQYQFGYKKQILESLKKQIQSQQFVFLEDSFSIYSSEELSPQNLQQINLSIEKQQVSIIFQQKQVLIDKEEQANLIKKLIKNAFNKLQFFKTAPNSYYNCMDNINNFQYPSELKLWPGFTYDYRLFQGKYSLVLNVEPHVFTNESVFQIIKKLQEFGTQQNEIKKFFYGKIVKTSYFSQTMHYKILDIDFDKSPNDHIITNQQQQQYNNQNENNNMTYIQFIEKQYKLCIRNFEFDQPLLKVISLKSFQKSQNNFNQQSQQTVYLVSSLCNLIIQNNLFKNHLPIQDLSFTFQDSLIYAQELSKHINYIQYHKEFVKFFTSWKLRLLNMQQSFDFQYKDPGSLLLKNKSTLQTELQEIPLKNLVFPNNITFFDQHYDQIFQNPFLEVPVLSNWLVVHHTNDQYLCSTLISQLSQTNMYFGYQIDTPEIHQFTTFIPNDWILWLSQQIEEQKYRFVLLVLPDKLNTPTFYRRIKELITLLNGVSCQVVLQETLQKFEEKQSFQTFTKRLLAQVAAKLGGAPWYLKNMPLSNKPTCVIGINVNRSKVSQKLIITSVFSSNKYFSRYQNHIFYQNNINDLVDIPETVKNLVKASLDTFISQHKQVQHVIIMRDGFFQHHCKEEVRVLKDMIQIEYADQQQKNIQMTYLTAAPEKNMKFFFQDDQNYITKEFVRSLGTGTVLNESQDGKIFILYVRKEERGAMFATRYSVLNCDSSNNDPLIYENIQNLVYRLCFLNFTMSSRTSFPAPLQYAWKLSEFISLFISTEATENENINLDILKKQFNLELFYI